MNEIAPRLNLFKKKHDEESSMSHYEIVIYSVLFQIKQIPQLGLCRQRIGWKPCKKCEDQFLAEVVKSTHSLFLVPG